MPNAMFLAPVGYKVGVTSICFGLIYMLRNLGYRVGYFKPIEQLYDLDSSAPDRSLDLIRHCCNLDPPNFISALHVSQLLTKDSERDLLEDIVSMYRKIEKDCDIIIVEGLYSNRKMPFSARLNMEIANALNAEVIFIASMKNLNFIELNRLLEITTKVSGKTRYTKVLGCIVNHINAPIKDGFSATVNMQYKNPKEIITKELLQEKCDIFKDNNFKLLGIIPWHVNLCAPRTYDIASFLGANFLYPGDIKKRRVLKTILGAPTFANLSSKLTSGMLLLVSGDQENIIMGACLATLNRLDLAGIVLTDGLLPNPEILAICNCAILTGLPIISTQNSLFKTAVALENMNNDIPIEDSERIDATISYMANTLQFDWIKECCNRQSEYHFSTPAFTYSLIKFAREAKKNIVLPEGEEARIIHAAIICHEKQIANCILLGDKNKIRQKAELNALILPENLQIINPDEIRHKYIKPLMEIRKQKVLTEDQAIQNLNDEIVIGTMMLALGEVDGLVVGATHTSADAIRPALRIIKTKPDFTIVSSIFIMCLPDQVVVYSDCAINQNPTAEELAEIAIQSAESAKTFGIIPKVAMISYSTGSSGTGEDVEKVIKATNMVREKRPDLLIDGPLQYDAAAIESVAKLKAPTSKVAGNATVFIFPDLNTGNTTYKAVKSNANVISLGPVLQGLRKPVSDLSRGALVEDIVYTIALTCIQAKQI